LTKKERVIKKLDAVVDLYNESAKLDENECFKTTLIYWTPTIQVFGNIENISAATETNLVETNKENYLIYKGVKFFQLRDMEKEIEDLKKKINQIKNN